MTLKLVHSAGPEAMSQFIAAIIDPFDGKIRERIAGAMPRTWDLRIGYRSPAERDAGVSCPESIER